MVEHKCNICEFKSLLKANYIRHLNSKKHKRNVNEDNVCSYNIIEKNDNQMTQKDPQMTQKDPQMTQKDPQMNEKDCDIKCEYCKKTFTTYAHKRRHEIHRCNSINIKNKIEEKCRKEMDEKYKNEIDKLHQKIEILLEKKGNTTNIFNIDKQINLNSYGKEDLSHITSGFKDHLLKIPFVSISKMIEEVHFSDKKPENNNIMLPNKKEKYIKVYENDKWVFKDKKSTITNLVDNKYNIIDDHYEENVNNDDKQIPLHLGKQYENFRDLYNDGDKELHTELRVDCELVLLNNRV